MKKILLLITFSAFFSGLEAQPLVNGDNNAPVKLEDVVKAYELNRLSNGGAAEENEKSKDGKIVKEDKNYHFQRWLWYWQAHTDENGYMVSPTKTFEEWEKYKNAASGRKTTAGGISSWSFQGPTTSASGYNGIGRINAMEFHPTDANTYWVATAGGGIWKTTNNGLNWTILTNHLPVLGTSDIDVNPFNTNTLYLCTGDRDASDTYSIGVMKSTDGGLTWLPSGFSWNTSQLRLTNCLVINKLDTNSLTLATSVGIYKSYNAGATWDSVFPGHFKQVLYHPTDTNVLYATRYSSGSTGAHIFRSANGGKTWTQATAASIPTDARRIVLAVTPGNVSIVKAVVANSNSALNGIYNSTDTGKTFTRIYQRSTGCQGDILSGKNTTNLGSMGSNDCGKQSWYDLTIAIHPTNPNLVYVGAVNTYRSTNGGTSWGIVTAWAGLSGVTTVHADKHFHAFHPLVADRLFECNDGGIYYSNNPTAASLWQDVTYGMGITQFYRNAVANNTTYVLAGSQDNGTKSLVGGMWDNESGGDGMDCQIDYADSTTFYTGVQYGVIYRFSINLGSIEISDNINPSDPPKGGWITPYILSPFNSNNIIAGYKNIYWSPDNGDNWWQVTTDSIDYDRFVLRVAMTPASDSTIYAVLSNSNKVYYTHKFKSTNIIGGSTIQFDSLQSPYSGNISDIKIDPKDRNHFWITYSGYGSTKVAEYKAGTWSKLQTDLPNVPIHCFEYDTSLNIKYVGTDVGVFFMDTGSTQWQVFNNGLPSIEVADLGINYTSKEIWAATYGRGLWKSVKQTNDTTKSISTVPYTAALFNIAPNPNNGRFTIMTTGNDFRNKQAMVTLLDNTGRVVLRQNNTINDNGNLEINAGNLPKGIYVIEVITDKNTAGRQRIIVN